MTRAGTFHTDKILLPGCAPHGIYVPLVVK